MTETMSEEMVETKNENNSYLSAVAEDICNKRYFQKDDDGNPIEDWNDLSWRVVNHVCKNESQEFKDLMHDLILKTEFIPNSPCLVNAGTNTKTKGLSACYIVKAPEDSWLSMTETIANFGHVARQGGGAGVSLSNIRPEGDPVFGSTHAKACGPVEHMRMISEVMSSITQSGFRSMAMLSTLRVDHPDILNFIKCKQKERALRTLLKEDFFGHYDQMVKSVDGNLKIILDKFIHNFNISVIVTDDFMEKVKKDEEYDLVFNGKVYQTLKARDVFNAIVDNAWRNGDPGFLFYDAMNDGPYKYSKQEVIAANPCFHGDSMVAVADGRNFVSIKQLAEEGKDVPVYCCNPDNGNIVIRWGRSPRKTRENVNLCKVTFDDGGSVITTPDHKILLRNGKYEEVQNLKVGSSIMTMSKFEYISHRSKYYGIIRGDGVSTKAEHKMIYKFMNQGITIKEEEVIHHKDFNGLNNNIENLEKMSSTAHSVYHRKFNNPMINWYPNATLEEKQRYHDNMSKSVSGELNGMWGKIHSDESKRKIGEKTKKRFKNPEFRKKHSNSLKKIMTPQRRKEMSIAQKKSWEEGKHDSLKAEMVTKKCEFCGDMFIRKSYKMKILRFCSPKCSNHSKISNDDIVSNAIEFVEQKGQYPSVVSWDVFENAIVSRELIRKRFGNFKNLNNYLVEKGVFAEVKPNSNMSQKMIAGAIVNWTIKNGKEPNKKDIRKICSKKSLLKNGGYKKLIDLANQLCLEHEVNHKVISVDMLNEKNDVYNITVDEHHNLCIFSSHKEKKDSHIKHKKRRRAVSRFRTVVYKNCGEQVGPNFLVCNLGSIDVSKFYNPQLKDLDWKKLKKTIHCAVQFLDNVIDANIFPTPDFEKWAKENRPIGLGIMGFADLLLKMKIAYGKPKSVELAEKLSLFFKEESHKKSVQLAKERGTPKCCKYEELDHRRGVTLLCIAPTGTISQLANCSHSIEPIYSSLTIRYDNTGIKTSEHPDADKPYFRCAVDGDHKEREVSIEEHIKIQAAFQKHIDAAVSKTINAPNSCTQEEIEKAFLLSHKLGCKGVTIYRDGSKSAQVLNVKSKNTIYTSNAPKRPKKVEADIFKTIAQGYEWHVIVGKVDGNPYELFAVNGKVNLPETGYVVKQKKQHYSLLDENDNILIDNLAEQEKDIDVNVDKETRRFSLELRHGISPKYIVQQIDRSNDVITSFCKAVTRIFKTKYISAEEAMLIAEDIACPECALQGKMTQLVPTGGCWTCPEEGCFYSRCG